MIFKDICKKWRSVIMTLEQKLSNQWIEEYNLAKKMYLINSKPSVQSKPKSSTIKPHSQDSE